ncbi:MAG: DMT family transporter [Bdellovibrionia bacterium]
MEANFLGPLCALCSALTWAIGSAGYSQLSKKHSAYAINFARALVSFPLSLITTFLIAGGLSEGIGYFKNVQASQVGWLSLSMLASYGVGDVVFLASTKKIGLPSALAIASCYPVWTVLGGYFAYQESITAVQFLGLLLTLAGVVFVILNSPEKSKKKGQPQSSFSFLGFGLAVFASMCWATNSFATARGGMGLIPPVGNSIRMSIGLLITLVISRVMAKNEAILLPKKQLIGSLWLFLIEAFGGSYFYFYGLSHSSLFLGSTLASLSPVIAVPIAVMWKLEKFSLERTFGVVLVVVGVWLMLGAV